MISITSQSAYFGIHASQNVAINCPAVPCIRNNRRSSQSFLHQTSTFFSFSEPAQIWLCRIRGLPNNERNLPMRISLTRKKSHYLRSTVSSVVEHLPCKRKCWFRLPNNFPFAIFDRGCLVTITLLPLSSCRFVPSYSRTRWTARIILIPFRFSDILLFISFVRFPNLVRELSTFHAISCYQTRWWKMGNQEN